jgi:hypothetical protein
VRQCLSMAATGGSAKAKRTQDAKYRVSDRVASRRLDDATIVAELRGGAYFELDPVGSLIWESLAEGASLETLVERVTEVFEVDAETARGDLECFLGELVERGLVVRS